MKKVFITGAAGFIGFHLAQFLKSRGDTVLGYDNFNAYYDPQLKKDRAQALFEKGVEVIEGDILDENFFKESVRAFNPTHFVHLAAQAGVRYSLENPKLYLKTNVDGFLNVLEICKENQNVKLIYASSSSVYGLNQKVPFDVEDRADQQASLYGVTKKTNELMAQTYHHLYGIPVTGLRFFTIYGPWGRPDMAYFLFTNAILEGKAIQIYNEGQMSRDFTYIDDIVLGIASAMDQEFACEIFNLGNHQPVPLLQFIQLIEKELGKEAKKNFLPMQPGDVVATYAEIEKSRKLLGFNPKVSIEEGIYKFIQWYRKYYCK